MRAFAVVACCALILLARPARAEERLENGYFVDRNGERVPFQPVYDGWFGADRYPKQYGRALGENFAFLGFELMLYWYDAESSAKDWQYPNLAGKLGANDVIRFDDNAPATKYVLQPASIT